MALHKSLLLMRMADSVRVNTPEVRKIATSIVVQEELYSPTSIEGCDSLVSKGLLSLVFQGFHPQA